MQPSTQHDPKERGMTPLRWIAGIIPIVMATLIVIFELILFNSQSEVRLSPTVENILQLVVMAGVPVAGVVVAIAWKGIGEIIGGLALVGSTVPLFLDLAQAPQSPVPELQSFTRSVAWATTLVCGAPFVISGLLFIGSGWYTLAHRHGGSQPRVPTPA